MKLGSKIVLAQLPLVAIFALVSVIFVVTSIHLGRTSQFILSSNFSSIIAIQKMQKTLGYIDTAVLMLVQKRIHDAKKIVTVNREQFILYIDEQRRSVDGEQEHEATEALIEDWNVFIDFFDLLIDHFDHNIDVKGNIDQLYEKRQNLNKSIAVLEDINYDAMRERSNEMQIVANDAARILVICSIAAFILGIFITNRLTHAILRPLTVFAKIVRSFAEGRLDKRVEIVGEDEVAGLGREFNAMASKLEDYRNSSIGELMQAKNLTQIITDAIPDPFFIFELRNKELIRYNHLASKLLNITADDQENLESILPKALYERLIEIFTYIDAETNNIENIPGHLKKLLNLKSDHIIQYSPFIKVLTDHIGKPQSLILILRNITDIDIHGYVRSDMLNNILNLCLQPLNIIQTSVHALLDNIVGEIDNKQAEFLSIARNACIQVRKIILHLNELEDIENSLSIELPKYSLQPGAVINKVIKEYRTLSEGRGIKIIANIPPLLPELYANEMQLYTVFGILLENAVAHAAEGTELTVALKDKGQEVEISVHNFGSYIEEDYNDIIFEKFAKLPEDYSHREGIGLYLAKLVVLQHNGRIWLESSPDKGTTFYIAIPITGVEAL